MVGLDQTSRVILSRNDARLLEQSGAGDPDGFSRWAADCTRAWIDYLEQAFPNRPEHRIGCFLHDPLVVAAVICPDILTWQQANVQVETVSDLARGLVVANRGLALLPMGRPNADVAVDTNVEVFRELFFARMARPA
jgi:inosine-uridine nucleoside N-ribohydrolase